MNVLLLARWFLMFVQFLIVVTAEDGTCRSGDISGNLTAVLPTCPNDTFTFLCTVVGDSDGAIHWRVETNENTKECVLLHSTTRDPHPCGSGSPFIAKTGTGFETTGATSFTSTLSGIATSELKGTLVECFVQHSEDPGSNPGQPFCRSSENMVGNITFQITGPKIVNISCHHLSNFYYENINVTVNWTLSSGNCADFYLINITTNAPQIPYGGFLNITTGNITWHELTGFMAGYEYNITIRGTCAGGQEGSESEPLPFTPKVPDAPAYCNCTVVYNQSSGMLQSIKSTWTTVERAVDPCPGISGVIKLYKMDYQTNIVNINVSMCMNGRCSHTFEPPSNPPSSYDSVSVAAENVVGVGAAKNCTAQPINATNNYLTGGIVDVSSPSNARLTCIYLSGFTGSARCRIQYGTDPNYINLPYSAESPETGTAGDTVSVLLRERLNSSSLYYYTVHAVSGDTMVTVLAEPFATPLYNCSPMELWNQTISNATFSPNVSVLDDATQYPSCDNRSVGNVVLRDTTLNTATVAYYTGTTTGSRACFVCDESNGYELTINVGDVCNEGSECEPNTTINERVCQSDATWSGSPITCVCTLPCLLKWHIGLIASGAFVQVLGMLIIVCRILGFCWGKCEEHHGNRKQSGNNASEGRLENRKLGVEMCNCGKKVKILCIILLVNAAFFCVTGVVLWISVGVVVDNPNNGDVCDTDWRRSRDGLIISTLVRSIITLLVAFMFTVAVGCYRKKTTGTFHGRKKRLLWLLIFSLAVHYPGDVAAQFNAAPPTCPGDNLIFNCTVGNENGVTLWRVGGRSECALVHSTQSDPHSCRSGSPFIVSTGTGFGTNATFFTSTLKATAISTLNGTLVECFGPAFSRGAGNLVGNSILQIFGPPSVSTLSCIDFIEAVSGAVSVTVSWSGGDSADFYLINITTNAPQTPYGGLLNITNASVTQRELTGFMAGYDYNITILGVTVDCGGLMGHESEPLKINSQGPPFVSILSCVEVFGNVSGSVNVMVNWTLSGGDSADFYLINITTNASQTPYGGLLNVISARATLTGFMAGYEYSITVRAVNCGSESEPLIIRPQVPPTPASRVCAVYDVMNETLQIIESNWNEVEHVTISEDCVNGRGIRANYELSYTTNSGPLNTTCVVDWTECNNGTCHHKLQNNTADSRCQPPVSQFSGEDVTVSVTASNIVGRSNPTVSRRIRSRKFNDLVARIDTTFVECTFFQREYTCTIDYGTDPSYINLVYRDTSSTSGSTATIALSQKLRGDTTYYYIVSVESDSQCVRVWGSFRADQVHGIVGGVVGSVCALLMVLVIVIVVLKRVHTRLQGYKDIDQYGAVSLLNHNTVPEEHEAVPFEHRTSPEVNGTDPEEPDTVPEENGTVLGEHGRVQEEQLILLLQKAAEGDLKQVISLIEKGIDVNTVDTHSGSTPLHKAAERGHKDIVAYLVAEKADVNIKDHHGRTPLHVAAREGYENTVKTLVEKGPDNNIKDNDGMTPLHVAAERGRSHVVKFLADERNINITNNKMETPLHIAAKEGYEHTVRYLCKAGADKTLKDKDRRTPLGVAREKGHANLFGILSVADLSPLHMEARQGDLKKLKSLIDEGADVNIVDPTSKSTPMHMAAETGHTDILIYLAKKGAGVSVKDIVGRTPLHIAARESYLNAVKALVEKAPDTINIKDNDGMTPLHVAAERGRSHVVKFLAENGADVNAKNYKGQTPLHMGAKDGYVHTVRYLLQNYADKHIKDDDGKTPVDVAEETGHVNVTESMSDNEATAMKFEEEPKQEEETSLYEAAKEGNLEQVKHLVDSGADTDTRDTIGRTALHIAAERGRLEIMHYLVDEGADTCGKDNNGRTPLHIAAGEDYLNAVEFLVDKGADVSITDDDGMTPLHAAAERGRFQIVDYLVNKGAATNTQDKYERTPLHIAAKEGYSNTAQSLLDNEADITIKDIDGRTPENVANEKGYTKIAELLQRCSKAAGPQVEDANKQSEQKEDEKAGLQVHEPKQQKEGKGETLV